MSICSLQRAVWFFVAATFVCIAPSRVQAQKAALTAEWIFGDEASSLADIPRYVWLADSTVILYDTRLPEAQRNFEVLDPATAKRHPVLDMPKAVASLKSLDPKSGVTVLPWPDTFDSNGHSAIYSFGGNIFLLDLPTAEFTRITNTPEEAKDSAFSPDGQQIAYVRANDIYVFNIATKQETRLTSTGTANLLNGTLSWVYWEEIFGRRDLGYWWSPDSRSIAFLETDESAVPQSTFVDFKPVDERIIHQRYPKTGETNPKVRVGVVDVANPAPHWLNFAEAPYEYVLRVQWLPDSERVAVQTMPRSQKENHLYFADAKSGAPKLILTETDPHWVNVTDDLHFLPDGQHFLWASERDGFMHLYRYSMDGTLVNKITSGDWALASSGPEYWVRQGVVGVDSAGEWIYFTSLKDSSIQRNLYRVKIDGSNLTRLSPEPGTHAVSMAPNARYYFDAYASAHILPALRLHAADGKILETIAAPRPELLPPGMQYPEFLTIKTPDGFKMPAAIMKPAGFDPHKKYPVILYVYGGPSAPSVADNWETQSFLVNQLLLRDGFVLAVIDNRAATGISKKLEDSISDNPAASETADLVAGVRWFKSQPWVDPARFGVWGWSGGGTMTLNLMTRSKEFKAGISVAPVTDWHYYDSKWGESLLGLPAENAAAYDSTSLVKHAGDLSGHLMIIFGTYDDNVHPQNEQAFMNELIDKGILFETMIYPMRKHGIADRAATINLYRTMREFWRRNL